MKKTSAFTLIELVVVVGLMLILFGVCFGLINSILQGTAKSELIKETKQNGNYALSIMERMIRNSQGLTCGSGPVTSITIDNPDGYSTTLAFTATNISSNSASLLTENKFTLLSYSFECSADSPSIIIIKFTLSNTTTSQKSSDQILIPFQTSVIMRTDQ